MPEEQVKAKTQPEDKSVDFLESRLYGKIPRKYADIERTNPDTEFSFKDKEEYWEDENIQKLFNETYGEENARDEFDKMYTGIALDYNNYSMGNFDRYDTEKFTTSKYAPKLTGIEQHDPVSIKQGYRYKTRSGAQQIGDMFTDQRRDVRAVNIDANKYIDLDGNEYDVKKDENAESGYTINGVDINDYRTDDGRELLGIFYDPETMDPYERSDENHLILGFEGQYKDVAGLEQVSHWDFTGVTTPHLESDYIDKALSIPKGVFNAAAGIIQGFNEFGAVTAGAVGADDLSDWFELRSMEYSSAAFSKTREAEENFMSFENLGYLGGDVITQIGSGIGAGRIVGGLSSKILGMTNAVNKSKAVLRNSRIASHATMTIGAGRDMRRTALANGFTETEAAWLYFGNLAGLFAAQGAAGYIDDAWTTTQMIKANAKHVEETIPYMAKTLTKEVVDESENRITQNAFMKFMSNTKNAMSGKLKALNTKVNSGEITQAMFQEAQEEMLEFVSEESVKQIGNLYVASGLAGREYGEAGQGRFKDIFDQGYWEEFGEGLALSAGLGAAGGGFAKSKVGKALFNIGGADGKTNSHVINMILDGKEKDLLDYYDEQHAKGNLGPTDLSIDFDTEGEYFKPYKPGVKGKQGINMNDGNLDALKQKFNYIKSTLEGLNIKGNIRTLLENNPDLVDKIDNTDFTQDVKDLISDYMAIAENNDDLAMQEIEIPPYDANEKEREKHIEKAIEMSGMSREDVERVIEIKEEINKFHTGEAAAKYHMQAMIEGGALDPKTSEYQEKYGEEYGDDLLYNMMRASHQTALDRQAKAEDIDEKAKDNDANLSNLEKDLSNIDYILSAIRTGDDLYLTDKSKDKIDDLVQNYKVPKEDLKTVKEAVKSKADARGVYNLQNLKENEGIKSIYDNNPDLKEQLDAFIPAYYNAKLDKQLENVNTLNDLTSFQVESPGHLFNSFLNSGDGNLLDMVLGNTIGKLKDMSPEEAKAFAEQVAGYLAENDQLYKSSIKSEGLNDFSPEAFKTIKNATDNYNKLVELNSEASVSRSEKDWAYKPYETDFLLKGFSGNHRQIIDEGNLGESVESLKQQDKDSRLPTGKSTFNNLDETEEVLKQVDARIDQIKALNDLYRGLSSLKARQARMDRKPSDEGIAPARELADVIDTKETAEFSKIFNETLYNPVLLSQLLNKDASTLTTEEAANLELMHLVNGSLAENLESLLQYKDELNVLRDKALDNKDNNRAEKIHLESLSNSVKSNISIMNEILDLDIIDKNNEIVDAFKTYYHGEFNPKNKSEDVLKEDFRVVYAANRYLYGLDRKFKEEILNEYKLFLTGNPNAHLSGTGINASKFTKAAVSLNFDLANFYSKFKGILESGEMTEMPTADQQEVAIIVAAHMSTDISNMLSPHMDARHATQGLLNISFVSGIGGSGKSTMVAGLGAKIGQAIVAEKYEAENAKVLLASNYEDQIDILRNTSSNPTFKVSTKTVGTRKGLTKEELIDYLKANRDMDDVSTIIYDEATFIRYTEDKNSTTYDNKSDLAKIEESILNINKYRKGKDLPKLKLVLMGDPRQNGATNETTGLKEHIGIYDGKVLTSNELTYSHRSSVGPLNKAISDILPPNYNRSAYVQGKTLNNLKTHYGTIKGREDNRKGGVQFTEVFNNEELLDHIEEQIVITNSSDQKFKVAVVTTEEIPDSYLSKMMKKYPDNFKLYTHSTPPNPVQGQEVDYVLATFTPEDIGNSILDWKVGKMTHRKKEEAAAYKMATTISRARYFAVVDNKTERVFESDEVDTISIPVDKDLQAIADKFRLLTIDMIPGESDIIPMDDDPDQEPVEENNEPEDQEIIDEVLNNEVSNNDTTEPGEDPSADDEVSLKKDQDKKISDASKIEEIREVIGEVKKSDEIKKEIADAVKDNDYSKVKELNDELLVAEFDENKKPTDGNLDEADHDAVDYVTSEISNPTRKDNTAEEVMRELEAQGILAGFSHLIDANVGEGYAVDLARLRMIYPETEIETEENTVNTKLRAMGLKPGSKYSQFDYSVVSVRQEENPDWTNVMIIARDKSTGKRVNLGSLINGKVLPNNMVGAQIINTLKSKLDQSGENHVEIPITRPSDIFEGFSSGKIHVNQNSRTTLKEFRKKSFPGVTFSDEVFVTTNSNDPHRGEAFIFYTFNTKQYDLSDTDDLLQNIPKPFLESDARSGFKDGLGYIRLDSKPKDFTQIYNMIDGTQSDKAKSMSTIVNTNRGQNRIVNMFAEITSVLKLNREQLLGLENQQINTKIEEILSEEEYKQYESRGPIFNVLKGLSTERDILEKIDQLLDLFFTEEYMGKHSIDNDGNIRIGKYKRTGEHYPSAAVEDFVITYLPKSSVPSDYGNAVSTAKFNMIAFYETIKENTTPQEFDRILSVFDELLKLTTNYSKREGGLFLRPQSVKNTPDNKYYDVIRPLLDLEDAFDIRVSNVTTPMVYLKGMELLDLINTNDYVDDKVKDIVKTINPVQVAADKDTYDNSIAIEKGTRDRINDLSTMDFNSNQEVQDAIYRIEDDIIAIEVIIEDIKDRDLSSELNDKVNSLKKFLEEAKLKAFENVSKPSDINDNLDKSLSNVKGKAAQLALDIEGDEEVSPQLDRFRSEILNLSRLMEVSSHFIFSPQDLSEFKRDLKQITTETDTELAQLIDEDKASLHKANELADSMKETLNTLNSRVTATKEDFAKAVATNMSKEFTMDELEMLLPDIAIMPADDINYDAADMRSLLTIYHALKLREENTSEVESRISGLVNYGEDFTSTDLDLITKFPITTMEEVKERIKMINKLHKDKVISKKAKDKAIAEVASAITKVKDLDTLIAKAEEAGKITQKEIDSIKDEDIKALLIDSFDENITDELSPEAREIFDRTWGPLEKFLSLKIDAQHIQDKVTGELENTISKVSAQTDFLLRFILDPDKRAEMVNEFNMLVDKAKLAVEDSKQQFEDAKTIVDSTIASVDNLIPTFNNSDLEVKLSPEAKQAIMSLDQSLYPTLISYLNGELQGDLNSLSAQTKLLDALEEVASGETLEQIETYLENKFQDKICGKGN